MVKFTLSSLIAAMKLVLDSLVILLSLPLFLNKSDEYVYKTGGAGVVRHVNNAPHHLIVALLYFTSIGPIRSNAYAAAHMCYCMDLCNCV